MNRNAIADQLKEIFRDVLGNNDISITESSTPECVDGWDSLAHISILEAVMNEFSIRFSLDEMLELTSFGKIIDMIIVKRGQVSKNGV